MNCLFLFPAFSIALVVFYLLIFGGFVTNPNGRINICTSSVEKPSVLEVKCLA